MCGRFSQSKSLGEYQQRFGFAAEPLAYTPRDNLAPGQEALVALAGLCDRWRSPQGRELRSFTILTTRANSLVEHLHPRMPVMLLPRSEALWLEPVTPPGDLANLAEEGV